MNALRIIERVREHDAELVLTNNRLVIRGRGGPLPDDLLQEVSRHKAELLVVLGEPMNATVAQVLQELRPHLPPSLRALPESKLLALVNWSIIAAWEAALRRLD